MGSKCEFNFEIFKTNIKNKEQSNLINEQILLKYPSLKVDFDLEDVDKILRIEGEFETEKIIKILTDQNIYCCIIY